MCREPPVSSAPELATLEEERVGGAEEVSFQPSDGFRPAELRKEGQAIAGSGQCAVLKSGSVGFLLGSRGFTWQFPSVVTSDSIQEMLAAPPATPLESEPNQALEPTSLRAVAHL
jgi:hypothetical protein